MGAVWFTIRDHFLFRAQSEGTENILCMRIDHLILSGHCWSGSGGGWGEGREGAGITFELWTRTFP